jgi:hypothetical protein
MTQAAPDAPIPVISVGVTQQTYPPHDRAHGTPHAVVMRVFTLELPQGTAVVDQTDYGHPGRFNPCHARSIPAALQPRTPQVLDAAEALARLL